MKTMLFSCVVMSCCIVNASGQETEYSDKKWRMYFQNVAKSYTISPDGEEEKPYTVTPQSVHDFHHQDGSGGFMRGTFFVWSEKGKSTAIGSFWSGGSTRQQRAMVAHEMHSLSSSPLKARRKGERKDFWSPRKPGLSFQRLKDISEPQESRGLRLAQMRSAARSFDGFVHRAAKTEPLRLQSEPLFRYTDNKDRKKVIDGAVFAYFVKWDPELLLVIEAHEEDGKRTWHYSGARMCNVALSLKRKGGEVWRVEEVPNSGPHFNRSTDAYYARHGVDFVDQQAFSNTPLAN